MSEYIYFNVWDGCFKMWGFDIFQDGETGECRLIVYFGGIHRSIHKLRKMEKPFSNFGDCYDYIMDNMKEKRAKGYIALKNSIYTEWSISEQPISALIQEIENAKKEP